ncbi:MerR family transcriptional regulator [Sphaerisporangium sp. TRM90804]|uniref:MerR family transcriptional regulator n=1 Tax=Sphaerisporangium sp. TRM90804 TaxID=3031113 RepID=UPI002447D9E0|nr:MerR family transcriptional regulator [Sphaerisporangium sp. TRM90804]MDH2425225.1 MerR family transcriptional regulator [Sphaerisporangium sp. TRM90804]
MRISQLSAASGVPIPTIKYYLREGLLPQGEVTAATRAEYTEAHLRRLRLIRALLEVGRLPVAAIGQIIAAVEDESLPVHQMLGTAHYALAPPVEAGPDDDHRRARERVDALVAELGWSVHPEAPTRDELAGILVRLDQLGMPASEESLRVYASIMMRLVSEHEMHKIAFDGPREAAVESVVVGTVLYGKAFDTLRRLAQESESARILGA